MTEDIIITKASGERVPFSPEKMRRSLARAGADEFTIERVMEKLQPHIVEGISTKTIYRHAFNILRKISGASAARYKLKQAIMELGPSGYPFERFIAEILKAKGFATQVGIIVEGLCVNHEVDIIAEKDNQHFMVECKFHNTAGIKSDVKIPLYIQARFLDIHNKWNHVPENHNKIQQGWVVTNTKFTEDAIRYGVCAGLNLLGWDYPAKGSLNELIDTLGLHPVTCLTTLTKAERSDLLEQQILLCRDLLQTPTALEKLQISGVRKRRVLEEVESLCSTTG